MNSVIEALYGAFPPERWNGPERKQAMTEYVKLREEIKAALGGDFVDRFVEASGRQLGREGLSDFAAGFRLAVRMMAEVLTSATV